VAAWEVPDIWIPTSAGRPMAEKHLASIDEETRHDVMNTYDLAIAH
jgi:hypothetical protein